MTGRYPQCRRTGPYIGWGALDGNSHGPRVEGGPADHHDFETLRSTWSIVYLDNGMMPPPRYFWGVRLWVYAASGRCWNLDLCWYSRRRYAESDANRALLATAYVEQQKARGDWPPTGPMGRDYLAAMMGAYGLGLVVKEKCE